MKVVLFSERLAPPFDEGIKNVVIHVLRRLQEKHQVLALTTAGADIPEWNVRNLAGVNRMLWDARLRTLIRAFCPDWVCYVPTASMTLPSFLRARVLRGHAGGAPVTMLALQPRRQGLLHRLIVPLIAPARVIVQSQASLERLAYLGNRVRFVPAGVDIHHFVPAGVNERERLRERYGLPPLAKVVLHVGHINRNRNVEVLKTVQEIKGVQTILVGSSSTPHDSALVAELQEAGVCVMDTYISHIEELYQLADLYVFPAPPDAPAENTPAIELPLSVLEAMACGLPIVTSRFGGLPALFREQEGFYYVDNPYDATEWSWKVKQGLQAGLGHTRRLVTSLTWEKLADEMVGLSRSA